MSNQFVVDLGEFRISDSQRESINNAIQSAVAKELSQIQINSKLVLIPISKWPKGPILDGIIARPLDKNIAIRLEKEGYI